MTKKDYVELPSKEVCRAIKKAKNRDLCRLKIAAGKDTIIVDFLSGFNLRMIPSIFTAPLQAVGLVASIFARMTNTKITLCLRNDDG